MSLMDVTLWMHAVFKLSNSFHNLRGWISKLGGREVGCKMTTRWRHDDILSHPVYMALRASIGRKHSLGAGHTGTHPFQSHKHERTKRTLAKEIIIDIQASHQYLSACVFLRPQVCPLMHSNPCISGLPIWASMLMCSGFIHVLCMITTHRTSRTYSNLTWSLRAQDRQLLLTVSQGVELPDLSNVCEWVCMWEVGVVGGKRRKGRREKETLTVGVDS